MSCRNASWARPIPGNASRAPPLPGNMPGGRAPYVPLSIGESILPSASLPFSLPLPSSPIPSPLLTEPPLSLSTPLPLSPNTSPPPLSIESRQACKTVAQYVEVIDNRDKPRRLLQVHVLVCRVSCVVCRVSSV
jgi:hypothetical protein